MTLTIKKPYQNDDGFINVEKVSGFVSREPTIAFRGLCLYASVSAVEKLNLKNFKRVNTSKIEPNKTNIPPNTLKLIEDAEKTIKLNSKSE